MESDCYCRSLLLSHSGQPEEWFALVKFTPSLDDNVDSTEGGRLAYELTDGKVVLHGHGLDPDVSPSLPNRMRLALEALTHKFISDKIITHSLEIKEEKVHLIMRFRKKGEQQSFRLRITLQQGSDSQERVMLCKILNNLAESFSVQQTCVSDLKRHKLRFEKEYEKAAELCEMYIKNKEESQRVIYTGIAMLLTADSKRHQAAM